MFTTGKSKIWLVGCVLFIISSTVFAKNIRIALAGALTGPAAQYGEAIAGGAQQAIDDINAKGGINGNKLVLIKYDDACDPKQAVAIAYKVVDAGIHFVIGHSCSSPTQPASDIYEDEGVLMITSSATSPEITKRGYQLVMRTIGLDSLQGVVAAKHIMKNVKPKRIALIHDRQQYGEGVTRLVKKHLEQANISPVLFEGITAGEKDFSTLVAKLKKEEVDFVYYGGYYAEMGQILRQARQAGLNSQFMGPEGVGNVSLSNIAGKAAEGVLVTIPKRYDQLSENRFIVNALKKKKVDTSSHFVWTSYAAVQALSEGIQRSKSNDPIVIVKNLKSQPVKTVIGLLQWDAKGDLTDFTYDVFRWHSDGSSTLVQ